MDSIAPAHISDSLTDVWINALYGIWNRGQQIGTGHGTFKEAIAAKILLRQPRRRIPLVPFSRWSLAEACDELYICLPDRPRWMECQEILQKNLTSSALYRLDDPCAGPFQFFRRESGLHLVVTDQWCNAWDDLPYRVFCLTALQELMARGLGVEPGTFVYQVGSLYLDEKDYAPVQSVLTHCEEAQTDYLEADFEVPLGNDFEMQLVTRAAWARNFDPKAAAERLASKLTAQLSLSTLLDYAEVAYLWKRVQLGVEVSEASRRTIEELLRQRLGSVFNYAFN